MVYGNFTPEIALDFDQLCTSFHYDEVFGTVINRFCTQSVANHPLTILATGMYGHSLLNQNGAPLRLVVPWKYGFKSIKSIVKIRFVEKEPAATWSLANSREYGFYSNVNPNVDHPRWTQATERRIGEFLRRPTLMFNGYSDEVEYLYRGMDLKKFY